MKRRTIVLVAAIAVLLLTVVSPASAGRDSNPVDICKYLEAEMPEAYEFLNTKPGGCVSSVASVGVDGLMSGAFPSTAAAVGQCKILEATAMMDPGEPNPGGPYPYQFYWFEGVDDFVAKNRADCVKFLEFFHTNFG